MPASTGKDEIGEDDIGELPVTSAQASVWLAQRLLPTDPSYNLSCEIALEGAVPGAVRKALHRLVDRHGALRTQFIESAGETRGIVQRVLAHASPDLVILDLRSTPMSAVPDETRRFLQVSVDLAFDLRRAPLLRAALVLGPGGSDRLVLVVHHLVSDGESLKVLAGEIAELYRVSLEGGRPALPAPAGYVAAVRREMEAAKERGEESRAWWADYLRGCEPTLALPLDRRRPSAPENWGIWVPLELSGGRGPDIQRWSRAHGVSSFAVVLACYAATLARYAGVDDVLVGVPVSDRGWSADGRAVGMFVHTLPVRIAGFADPAAIVIGGAQRSLGMVLDHQSYPIEALVAEFGDFRDPSSHPLFAATATHQPFQRVSTEPGRQSGTIRFDLSLRLDEDGQTLGGALGGRAQLFDATTIEAIRDRIGLALDQVIADANRPFGEARWTVGWGTPTSEPHSSPRSRWPRWRTRLAEALSDGRVSSGGVAVGTGVDPSVGPVVVTQWDRPEHVGAALGAMARGQPLLLPDPQWPPSWREHSLDGLTRSKTAGGAIFASEFGPDGHPRLMLVPPEAQMHAVWHASQLQSVGPGQLVVVAGLPPALALLHGVVPAILAGAHAVVVPGEVASLLDAVAWDSPTVAVVDERRALAMHREGWDVGTRILVPGNVRSALGLTGPAATGFAAALADGGRLTLLPQVWLAHAPAPGAVGQLALGTNISDARARMFSDGGLELPVDGPAPRLTPSELLEVVTSLPGIAACSLAPEPGGLVVRWVGTAPELEAPEWLVRARVGDERRRWRAVRFVGGPDPIAQHASGLSDLAEVVRLTSEHTLGVPVASPDASFYELGAQSLTVVRLAAELSDLLATEVALADVFRFPSVRQLADQLSARSSAERVTARARQVIATLALSDVEVQERAAVMMR